MELSEYFRIIRRRIWIPILLVVVTALTAGAVVFVTKPEYTATATIIARNAGGDKTLNFAEVAASNSLALRVVRQLKLDENVDQVSGRIKVTSGRTNLYRISVSDPNPQRAAAVANAVAREAAALYQELASGTKSSIVKELDKDRTGVRDAYLTAAKALVDFNIQHPETVGPTANPRDVNVGAQALLLRLEERAANDAYLRFQGDVNKARLDDLTTIRSYSATVVDEAAGRPDTRARYLKILYASALALVLGIGLIFGLEYFDNSLREPEAVEELVGVPVIAIIPRGTSRTLRPARGGAQ
jgi:capsular polysaccharide biosynthesis protein